LTGEPEHESQDRTGRNMTGRIGKAEQDGQTEQDRQNRTVKTGQTNQAGETGQAE
jgi:hypothetical protein